MLVPVSHRDLFQCRMKFDGDLERLLQTCKAVIRGQDVGQAGV